MELLPWLRLLMGLPPPRCRAGKRRRNRLTTQQRAPRAPKATEKFLLLTGSIELVSCGNLCVIPHGQCPNDVAGVRPNLQFAVTWIHRCDTMPSKMSGTNDDDREDDSGREGDIRNVGLPADG